MPEIARETIEAVERASLREGEGFDLLVDNACRVPCERR
jgi:hypothetical protein